MNSEQGLCQCGKDETACLKKELQKHVLLAAAQSRSLFGAHDESCDESCNESHDKSPDASPNKSCDESPDESPNVSHDESHESHDSHDESPDVLADVSCVQCDWPCEKVPKGKEKENVQLKRSHAISKIITALMIRYGQRIQGNHRKTAFQEMIIFCSCHIILV